MTTPDWPGREELAHRAQRRWWITQATIFVVVGIGVLITSETGILGSQRHRHAVHHHRGVPIVPLIVAAVVAIAGLVALVFLIRAMRRPHGMFSAQIVAGLPRSQRRAVGRAIRRGTPSPDPTLAAVEYETAERTVRFQRWIPVFFGVFALLELPEAITHNSLRARIFFTLAVVMVLVFGVYAWWFGRRARRYLDLVNR